MESTSAGHLKVVYVPLCDARYVWESFPYVHVPKCVFKFPRSATPLSSAIWPLPFVHCVCPAWLLSSFSPLIGLHTMQSVLQLSQKASCAASEQCPFPWCVHNFACSSIQARWQTANCLASMCQATWFTSLFDCTGPFLNAPFRRVWPHCIGKNCHGRKLEILIYRLSQRIVPVCGGVIWWAPRAQKPSSSRTFMFFELGWNDWLENQAKSNLGPTIQIEFLKRK